MRKQEEETSLTDQNNSCRRKWDQLDHADLLGRLDHPVHKVLLDPEESLANLVQWVLWECVARQDQWAWLGKREMMEEMVSPDNEDRPDHRVAEGRLEFPECLDRKVTGVLMADLVRKENRASKENGEKLDQLDQLGNQD
jgi:hypothetical protein